MQRSIRYAVGLALAGLLVMEPAAWAHDSGFGLARYTPDGALDPTFGVSGVVVTRSAQRSFVANALALQPDGKIVIGGMLSDLVEGARIQLAVARYNADGTRDTGFGTDGTATSNVGAGGALANAIAIQPDGKIVVAGLAFSHGTSDDQFALARFTVEGQADAAFGTGGVITTHVGAAGSTAQAVVLQPDGRILVAGTAFANGPTDDDFALARYTASGSLDVSFGGGGVVTTDFGSTESGGEASLDRVGAVVLAPNGRIVVAGITRGEHQAFSVARYDADGTLDAGFGSGGKAQVSAADPQVYGVVVQAAGDVVVAGSAGSATRGTAPFAIVRLLPDGTPDQRFGTAGLVTTSFEGSRSGARAVVVQADGKLLTAGAKFGAPTSQGEAQSQSGFAVARYAPDGAIDTSFGNGGRVLTDMGDAGALPLSLVIQPDGKIIAAGLVFFRVPSTQSPIITPQLATAAALVILIGLTLSVRLLRPKPRSSQ